MFLSAALVIGAAIAVKSALRSYDGFLLTWEASKLHRIHPSPEHSPADVVRLQFAALGHVDEPRPGAGIAFVYRFLAPEQRDAVGGLDQLEAMFNRPPLVHLVGYKSAQLQATQLAGDRAAQPVLVQTRQDHLAAYMFQLAKQQEGEHAGSWLIESVGLIPMTLHLGGAVPPQSVPAATPAD